MAGDGQYDVAPVPAVQLKDTLEALNTDPGAGDVITAFRLNAV